eukprot:9939-Heterococcus_DN1.PRE.6
MLYVCSVYAVLRMCKVLHCRQRYCYCCWYYYTCVGAAALYIITMYVTAVPTAELLHIAAVHQADCVMYSWYTVVLLLLLFQVDK